MKKFAAIALALIVAMSGMFATVASAADDVATVTSNKLAFTGFEIVEGSGVIVDLENMLIYGLEPELYAGADETMYELDKYLKQGDVDEMIISDDYLGTGSTITLIKDGVQYPFTVVIFGDVTGDSVYDVLDMVQVNRFAENKAEPEDIDVIAVDTNEDGEISPEDYSSYVNTIKSNDTIDQNAGKTDTDGLVEIDDQVYTSENADDYQPVDDEDITLSYNDIVVDEKYYTVDKESYKYTKNDDGEIVGTVNIEGKGLFGGTITVEFNVVSLLEKIVGTVNEVIEDANLAEVVTAEYNFVDGVADIQVKVDASDIIRGNFNVDMAGLNGLLTKIDSFKAKYLQEASLTVGDLAIATNGDFDRSAIKALVFDIAKGIFCDIANADDNVVKSYSGALVTNNDLAHLTENFNIDVVMTGTGSDIDRVKAFAAKISRYVAFDVVDGNAVIDIAMPAAFATKVVDVLSDGTGSVEDAKAMFDSLKVDDAFTLLSLVTTDDISVSSASELNHLISVVAGLDAIVDKALDEVASATATDVNGEVYELLNGSTFYIENASIKAIVEAIQRVVDGKLLGADISAFANGDVYTAEFDVTLDYRNISEKVIVNLDLFGAAETPTIIEETATYFSDIIADLGLSNVASVSYDKDACRAVAALNAREFATNLTFDENAIDGLYTEIRGYFDDNYGTSTIVVGGYEIVTAGAINKSALKSFIFSAAAGFFEDASNIGADNVLRSFNTVVTEADGTTHNFDLDFALEGTEADIARVEKIAAKVADYVSFEVVNGNAVVNVGLPAGMRNTIIEYFGEGDAQAAKELLDSLTIEEAFSVLSHMDAEHISASSSKEIQAIVDLICGFDKVINKVLSKVSASTTVNGVAYNVLADNVVFDLEGASSIAALVEEVAAALNPALKGLTVADFANEDGTYTLAVDAAVSIGGIKETVILNLDVFGDIEKENAIEDTVDYVDGILADLGLSDMASVTFEDGKAVAAFDASEFIANGFNFDENSFDGLYSEIRGYFDDNFSDSTITVGDFELVTDGKINKAAVKDFIFDFATGFFTDVANMDAATLRSYSTVVVDAEGNEEVFAFDFNLDGEERHIEKIKELSAKVAAHVSFAEVDGNAAVSVNLPAGMKNTIVEYFGEGDKAAAVEVFNKLTVSDAFDVLAWMDADHISASSAADIERIIGVICDVSVLANKVLSKVDNASVVVNGENVNLLAEGASFNLATKDIAGLAGAVQNMLGSVKDLHLADFQNADGTYTVVVNAGTTIGGINETITINVAIF